jgi:hypothetical protein
MTSHLLFLIYAGKQRPHFWSGADTHNPFWTGEQIPLFTPTGLLIPHDHKLSDLQILFTFMPNDLSLFTFMPNDLSLFSFMPNALSKEQAP